MSFIAEFYCEICQVQSTNLSAHYDHLHSKRHQKATGAVFSSTTTVRPTLEQVMAKLNQLKEEHAAAAEKSKSPISESFRPRSERLEEEIAARRIARKLKKVDKKTEVFQDLHEGEEETEKEAIQEAMAASGFSFSSFSSSKR